MSLRSKDPSLSIALDEFWVIDYGTKLLRYAPESEERLDRNSADLKADSRRRIENFSHYRTYSVHGTVTLVGDSLIWMFVSEALSYVYLIHVVVDIWVTKECGVK
ncbi:hypothetical protein JRO89_XS07G0276000 [Xanthoceras sorbifolium]|uniref:Uncharacterized protein n=1 Tax=Xanthoceras sorbifolium TaxID=99658 RepID=A0ABQ8HVD1_9ROSI|nr:hypothetical protein JRO89_XSUnG0059100 [Xanthoceras sorbifolium]KAH7568325.1 hypothetical protein JRO89_XS07G0276000 [Xanthoceras sorbifolium]